MVTPPPDPTRKLSAESTRSAEDPAEGAAPPTVPMTPITPATGPAATPGRSFSDRDLPIAVLSGITLALAFLGTLFWHPAAFTVFVIALVVVGLVETALVLRRRGLRIAVPILIVGAAITLAGAYQAGHEGQALGLVTIFVGAFAWELADERRTDVLRSVAVTVLLGMWVAFLASYAVLLAVREVDAWVAVLATIGVAAISDVGAYLVGIRFGRTRLAPAISPGKTWEGVFGGLLLAAVVAALVLPNLGPANLFDVPTAIVFALVVGAVGVVGDLAESMLKRDLGVKDFGAIIPGHGGILDRVDGILFALPVGYYLLELFGR